MKNFNLYKKAKWGWFHVTAGNFRNLSESIAYYKEEFNIKIGNEYCNYKVTGL
jgi:hypothetical protein